MRFVEENLFLKTALKELYREFQRRNIERKLGLKPCLIQIVESRSFWGKWNGAIRTLLISEHLIETYPWHDVIGVLRHEMAHQYAEEILGVFDQPHGDAFKKSCEKVGVPHLYINASVHLQQNTLDWRQTPATSQEEILLEKVRKLLNLAQSANENEAALAMSRVQEIYARYNLQKLSTNEGAPDFYHHYVRTGRRRLHTFEQKIMSILVNHYFVEVIVGNEFDVKTTTYHRVIELIGTKENVLMADYVFTYLQKISSELTQQRRKLQRYLSKKSLNDYQMGLLVGFDDKLNALKEQQGSREIEKSLALFKSNKPLKTYIAQVHPHLVTITSKSSLRDRGFFEEGRAEGRRLNIQRPFHETPQKKQTFFLK